MPEETQDPQIQCCYCWGKFPVSYILLDSHNRKWCRKCHKEHVEPNLPKSNRVKLPF